MFEGGMGGGPPPPIDGGRGGLGPPRGIPKGKALVKSLRLQSRPTALEHTPSPTLHALLQSLVARDPQKSDPSSWDIPKSESARISGTPENPGSQSFARFGATFIQ